MRCKHNWVRSGHGNDLICTKCGYAAAQATLTMPSTTPIQEPMLRETIEIPMWAGDKVVRGKVYKDEIEKQMQRSMGLDIGYNIMQDAFKKQVGR